MSATGLPDKDLKATHSAASDFTECQCQGDAGCPHHGAPKRTLGDARQHALDVLHTAEAERIDAPPFSPHDWVVWDGRPEPTPAGSVAFGTYKYSGGRTFIYNGCGPFDLDRHHMRLATPADFDAAIARREAEIAELKKARGPSAKTREILASLATMKVQSFRNRGER